ncbi:MAG: co-chaperone GroES [Candidatus Aminicenantes bacterium]|nr:co-chaperone GroES [Candidatus Aminicenantes bacterium]
MKIEPIKGRILVKPIKANEKTSKGIYIPDTSKKKMNEGKIVALAEDSTEEVAVGDHVVFKEFSGTELKFEGEKYILLNEEDLLVKYIELDEIPE